MITRSALEQGWPRTLPFQPRAMVIRTLPNDTDKMRRDYTDTTPPYLSREAAEFLVARGIEHLVVDLPSIDRSHDEGRLTAHRVFFGLPGGSRSLALAAPSRNPLSRSWPTSPPQWPMDRICWKSRCPRLAETRSPAGRCCIRSSNHETHTRIRASARRSRRTARLSRPLRDTHQLRAASRFCICAVTRWA